MIIFESSDNGAYIEVFEVDGTFDQIIKFRVDTDFDIELHLSTVLEMFRLFNAVWYSQIVNMLNICHAPTCDNEPKGCHVRKTNCPKRNPVEEELWNNYNRTMREMHMETKRAPIAP